MKITLFRNVQSATTTAEANSETAALKTGTKKVSAGLQHLNDLPKKNDLPAKLADLGKGKIPGGLGKSIPGMNKSDLTGGIGKNGIPGLPGMNLPGLHKDGFDGGLGKQGLPGLPGNNSNRFEGLFGGLGKSGLPGKGKDIFGDGMGLGNDGLGSGEGIPGMGDSFGGFGGKGGPGIKIPGAERMDGDGPSFFGKGTWDIGPNGLHGSFSGGVTYGGYGAGVNDKGQVGVAKGDALNGGSVTSPADAQGAASSAISGGGTSKNTGVPEGLDWSRGTRIKDSSTTKDSSTQDTQQKNTEGPNDLGPSTNDPATEKKEDENQTAVAQNDTTKNNQAGKPNPDAMPNPEDSGGGTPRSNVARTSGYFMPNPEDSGGGTPRSHTAAIADLFMPNPEDSGGGTPRSVIANIAMKLRG